MEKVASIPAVRSNTRMQYLVQSWLLFLAAGSAEICKNSAVIGEMSRCMFLGAICRATVLVAMPFVCMALRHT